MLLLPAWKPQKNTHFSTQHAVPSMLNNAMTTITEHTYRGQVKLLCILVQNVRTAGSGQA